jgi:transposase
MRRELPPQIVELTDAQASAPTAATGAMVVKLCADRRSLEVSFDLNGSRAAAARRSERVVLAFGGGRMFLVAGATDMRKSFSGLACIAREKLATDQTSCHWFFFCNRDRNRLKALVVDESVMWVLGKR